MSRTVHAGIDVSARSLVVCVEIDGDVQTREVDNTASGHRQLIRWLTKRGRRVRVVLEASGIYGLDLALALHKASGVEVMVANPRAARNFAKALLKRSKTDAVDAGVLLELVRRMPFTPWQPPPPVALDLRAITRRLESLTKARTRERNRLHATRHARALPALVRNDIEVNLRHLTRRIEQLERQAVELIRSDDRLSSALDLVTSIKGVGTTSGVQILAELSVLPLDMTVRQWVAHAGLDPRAFDSGETVHKPARISKVGNRHLRSALFMPALVACQHEPRVRAFYLDLVARDKEKKQAVVAVMRKLLHSIYGMIKHQTPFHGELFYTS